MKTNSSLLLIAVFFFHCIHASAQWKQTKGPYSSGYATTFVKCGNAIYLSNSNSVMLRSVDDGHSWQQFSSGLTIALHIPSMVSVDSTVFAGVWNQGIYSSTNGGSWIKCAGTGLTSFDVMLAAGSNGIYAASVQDGVFFSSNKGNTWTKLSNDPGTTNVSAIAVNGSSIYTSTDQGMYVSVNNGNSWTLMNNSLTSAGKILVKGSILYALVSTGIYTSSNNGQSWTLINATTPANDFDVNGSTILVAAPYSGQSGIFISKDHGNTWNLAGLNNIPVETVFINNVNLIAGTNRNGIFTSTDEKTWIVRGSFPGDVRAVYSLGSRIFAGTTYGLFVSSDSGSTWNITDAHEDQVSVLIGNAGELYAGTSLGLRYSADSGKTWVMRINDLLPRGITDFYMSGSSLIAATDDGIYVSSDKGVSFTQTALQWNLLYSVESDGNILYTTTYDGIYTSSDGGLNWNLKTTTGLPVGFLPNDINYMGGKLWLNTFGQGLYISTDHGSNWTAASSFPDQTLHTEFTTKGDSIFAVTSSGVYMSSNKGNNWTVLGTGLSQPQSIVLHAGGLWAGTLGGVFSFSPSVPTSVSNPSLYSELKVYPNPSSNVLFIKTEGTNKRYEAEIIDVLGKSFVQFEINHQCTVDISDFAPGMYLIKYRSDKSEFRTERFIRH